MKALYAFGLALMICGPETLHAQPTYLPAQPDSVSPAIADAKIRSETKPITASKVILVGDSTTQVGTGWGGAFCGTRLVSSVSCIDLARGGRSTFDYRAEGSWNIALSEMRTPGYRNIYVLIQFGHNDQPGKPGRSTDLHTEFPSNLAEYVTEARKAGAIPILVTPLARRSFKSGSLQDTLNPWADAVRKVAEEMDVPLIDLHAMSIAAVQQMGPTASLDLAQADPPQYIRDAAATGTSADVLKPTPAPSGAVPDNRVGEVSTAHLNPTFDYTHLGPRGAAFFSAQVAEGLAKAVPDLRGKLILE